MDSASSSPSTTTTTDADDPNFTPDDVLDLLFDAQLIPQVVKDALPPGFHIRPLASTDRERGHLQVLSVLTSADDAGPAAWTQRFDAMRAVNRLSAGSGSIAPTYCTLVVLDKTTDRVVAVGTLLLELKFQRGTGAAAHIEDIAVDGMYQGRKLGQRVVRALASIGEAAGAYKVILDCREHNVEFYQKCGFQIKGRQMVKYFALK